MPDAASCASGRHQPLELSAGSAIVRLPPGTGVLVSVGAPFSPEVVWVVGLPLLLLELPFLELLPHADAITASVATTATADVTRDLRLRTTVPPDSSQGSTPTYQTDVAKLFETVTKVTPRRV